MFISQVLTGALIRFYEIKNSCSDKILEIFYEKLKDLFLRNDLYRVIYDIKSKIHSVKKNKFSINLMKLYNSKPYYFSSNPYFCMDIEFKKIIKKTSEKFNTYNINKNDNENKKEMEKEEENEIHFDKEENKNKKSNKEIIKNLKIKPKEINSTNMNDISLKQNKNSNEVYKNILTIPFEKTLLILRTFNDCNNMLKKLDLMFELRSSILEEIDFFWEGVPLKSKYKSLDADNILSIFVYLIIKSQLTNLPIHLEIMDSFFSNKIKLSRKGYFFSIFQSSIEYIVDNLTMKAIDENIKEYNDCMIKELKKLNTKPYEIFDNLNNLNNDKINSDVNNLN